MANKSNSLVLTLLLGGAAYLYFSKKRKDEESNIVDGEMPNQVDDVFQIYGCMDESAINYNPEANADNDTCIYSV